MGKINLGRVALGGIVAGIVIDIFEGISNGLILDKQVADVMTGLGKSGAISAKQLIAFSVWGLAVGILMVWLYAAMRPRLGAGPKTAIYSGLAVWAAVFVLGSATTVFLHLMPVGLTLIGLAVALVETIVAGLAGASLYKEEQAEAVKSSAARA
jgi:hypothetical protein